MRATLLKVGLVIGLAAGCGGSKGHAEDAGVDLRATTTDLSVTDAAAPDTACGLHYGTTFTYVVGQSQVIKVYLDGEVDEVVAGLTRSGNNSTFFPGGIHLTASTITLAGGRTQAGTPQPGWWQGAWPPVGGEGPSGVADVAILSLPGGSNEGPLRLMTAGSLFVAQGTSGVYSIDLNAKTSTLMGAPTLPAYYRITEFLDASPDSFTVLASVAPIAGVNNRAFLVTANNPMWTTTEVPSLALPVDEPIIAVRRTADNRALWFDARGFYLDGTRVRDVHHCFNGNLIGDEVFGVEQ